MRNWRSCNRRIVSPLVKPTHGFHRCVQSHEDCDPQSLPDFPFRKELGCRTPSYEGNATWTVALANHLAKIPDTEVHVVTEADGIPQSAIVANGVQVHFITAPEKYKTLTLWHYDRERMMQALDQIQPDIVHGQGIENQYGFVAVTSKWPHR